MSLYHKIHLTGVLEGKSEHQEETISRIGTPLPFLISLAFCGLCFPLKQWWYFVCFAFNSVL